MVIHCPKCNASFKDAYDLKNHLNKKYSCTLGKFDCVHCKKKFMHRSGRDRHQKRCIGPCKTIETQDAEINNLRTTISAIHGQQISLQGNSSQSIHIGDNISNVHNIQQNIHVNVIGKENDSHILNMPIDQLLEKIGDRKDMGMLVELFKMRRLDPSHPENHNLLLINKDDDHVHYFTENGWKQCNTDDMLSLILNKDSLLLQSCLNPKDHHEALPVQQQELWKFLATDVIPFCSTLQFAPFKPYMEKTRNSLSVSTALLSQAYADKQQDEIKESTSKNDDHIGDSVLIEREKTLRLQEKEKTEREREKTEQLRLQVELARLKQSET